MTYNLKVSSAFLQTILQHKTENSATILMEKIQTPKVKPSDKDFCGVETTRVWSLKNQSVKNRAKADHGNLQNL